MTYDHSLAGIPVLLLFVATLLEYHASELLLVLAIEPEEFSFPETLLITTPYVFAMTSAATEYVVTCHLLPSAKTTMVSVLAPFGICLVVAGEGLRKLAWLQARKAFTHKIKTVKRPCHALVTHGVYSFCRHPGYLGWLIWAVGTQLLLGNVICTVGFAVVSWRFFSVRIPFEDHHLGRL